MEAQKLAAEEEERRAEEERKRLEEEERIREEEERKKEEEKKRKKEKEKVGIRPLITKYILKYHVTNRSRGNRPKRKDVY